MIDTIYQVVKKNLYGDELKNEDISETKNECQNNNTQSNEIQLKENLAEYESTDEEELFPKETIKKFLQTLIELTSNIPNIFDYINMKYFLAGNKYQENESEENESDNCSREVQHDLRSHGHCLENLHFIPDAILKSPYFILDAIFFVLPNLKGRIIDSYEDWKDINSHREVDIVINSINPLVAYYREKKTLFYKK